MLDVWKTWFLIGVIVYGVNTAFIVIKILAVLAKSAACYGMLSGVDCLVCGGILALIITGSIWRFGRDGNLCVDAGLL